MDFLSKLIDDKEPLPNKFTIKMGELIRLAREGAGLSQSELSKRIYRRQATISDLENGKMVVDSLTLMLLASRLDKPISYFFKPWSDKFKKDDITPEEQELLIQARRLKNEDLRKLIAQVRALAEYDDREFLAKMAEEYQR